MIKGFWQDRTYPLIGLAPMDGVTDAPFRAIAAKYGHPDLIITEFTSAEGIRAGALRLMDDFRFNESERPVVAQLFGADPAAFYLGAAVAAALGFDGVDINMGCPAKAVTSHGAGAALIQDPERAKKIIEQAKQGTKDWNQSRSVEEFPFPEILKAEIKKRREALISAPENQELPVSVKTRIGYDSIVIEDWVRHLLETDPVAITVHGRTLKQLYTGLADWDAIGRAAAIIKQTETKVLGNGDVQSRQDGIQKCHEFGVDGVLIGRAAFGNPWVFTGEEVDFTTKMTVALEHSRLFAETFPPQAFVRMRKHLLDYVRNFEGAKEVRIKLMRTSSIEETEAILLPYLA